MAKQNASFWGGNIPWVSPKDMKSDIVLDSIDHVTDAAIDQSAAKRIPDGSILIVVRSGILARTIPTAIAGRELTVNQDLKAIVPDKRLDRHFLAYFFRAAEAQLLDRVTRGATVHKLDMPVIKSLGVPLPPLEEQQRIVAVLDEVIEGLARARAHAEANLQNARELFENILSHTLRHRFKQGTSKLLGDVCELAQGLAINKGTKNLLVEKSSKPLLRIKDLRNNSVEQYVAETGFPPKAEISKRDIIYTRTGQIGLVFRGFEGVLHRNCFSISALGEVIQGYLFWWLQEPVFKSEIVSLASRAAQPDITHKIFKARSITYPSINDQKLAVELIENAFYEAQGLEGHFERKLQDIDDLRQSLLQKAFAGELT